MKSRITISLLFALLTMACTTPPKQATADFLQGTWTSTQYKVNYGFIGKHTMFISDEVEGEEYNYFIKGDTIIFQMQIDELIGNTTEFDTMTYKIIDNDTIELNYQGLKTKIVRDTIP
jgi:hypothetical protein